MPTRWPRSWTRSAPSEPPSWLKATPGPTAIFFAATKPDRTTALILSHTTPKYMAADDYPIGVAPEVAEAMVAQFDQLWGTDALVEVLSGRLQTDPVGSSG